MNKCLGVKIAQTFLVFFNSVKMQNHLRFDEIETIMLQGRFVRAIRDIEPGEVVLVDVAAVAGPLLTQKPLCLECHKQLRLSIEEK
jgi:hypothetical protein